jgi:hypothetical protein
VRKPVLARAAAASPVLFLPAKIKISGHSDKEIAHRYHFCQLIATLVPQKIRSEALGASNRQNGE